MARRKVVEMRLRGWKLIELALRARDQKQAEKIIEDFTNGKIGYQEAYTALKKLVEA